MKLTCGNLKKIMYNCNENNDSEVVITDANGCERNVKSVLYGYTDENKQQLLIQINGKHSDIVDNEKAPGREFEFSPEAGFCDSCSYRIIQSNKDYINDYTFTYPEFVKKVVSDKENTLTTGSGFKNVHMTFSNNEIINKDLIEPDKGAYLYLLVEYDKNSKLSDNAAMLYIPKKMWYYVKTRVIDEKFTNSFNKDITQFIDFKIDSDRTYEYLFNGKCYGSSHINELNNKIYDKYFCIKNSDGIDIEDKSYCAFALGRFDLVDDELIKIDEQSLYEDIWISSSSQSLDDIFGIIRENDYLNKTIRIFGGGNIITENLDIPDDIIVPIILHGFVFNGTVNTLNTDITFKNCIFAKPSLKCSHSKKVAIIGCVFTNADSEYNENIIYINGSYTASFIFNSNIIDVLPTKENIYVINYIEPKNHFFIDITGNIFKFNDNSKIIKIDGPSSDFVYSHITINGNMLKVLNNDDMTDNNIIVTLFLLSHSRYGFEGYNIAVDNNEVVTYDTDLNGTIRSFKDFSEKHFYDILQEDGGIFDDGEGLPHVSGSDYVITNNVKEGD